jgi:hypothetical protein
MNARISVIIILHSQIKIHFKLLNLHRKYFHAILAHPARFTSDGALKVFSSFPYPGYE